MKRILLIIALLATSLPTSVSALTLASANENSVWSFADDGRTPVEAKRLTSKSIAPGSMVAIADFGLDGVDELIVGSGPGRAPTITMLRGDGTPITSFPVFEPTMMNGVRLAVGDVDGDTLPEIITATGPGISGRIMIYDRVGGVKGFETGFSPYAKEFRGGVFVAVGDVDGNGRAEIITGAGAGGGPHVRVFNENGELFGHFFAFDPAKRGGVMVAAGDVDGDGKIEIIAALSSRGDGTVTIFNGQTFEPKVSFKAYGDTFNGGLSLSMVDINGDGADEIVTAPLSGGGPQVRVFDHYGRTLTQFFSHDPAITSGLSVAAGKLTNVGPVSFVAVPHAVNDALAVHPKVIDIDLSEQRLRAYEYGALTHTFLISSGARGYATPTGTFSVLAKPYTVLYRGPGWDFGLVPWNLRFLPHHLIHYAYWHNNFGRPMSHGCINVDKENAKWIYEWADVGTPVVVRD